MSKWSAIVLMPFPIACIGLLLVTACAASGDDPPPTPTATLVVITRPPHPDIAAAMTAIAEDNLKPRFTGVLNGFTFIGLGTPVPRSIDCTNAELKALSTDEASEAIRASDLEFEPTILAPDLALVSERATICNDEVISVGRVYEGDSARLLSIVRVKAAPIIESSWAQDTLAPRILGGRDAVVVGPVATDSFIVFLRDEETLWIVSADPFEIDEVIAIADGLH
jgi:hypothetical protein